MPHDYHALSYGLTEFIGSTEQMDYLERMYPIAYVCLYISPIEPTEDQYERYFHNSPVLYSFQVIKTLAVNLPKMRQNGKLLDNQTRRIKLLGINYEYKGEIN